MIRVVIYGPSKKGFFPYRVDGHWGPGGAPLIGLSDEPLLEACRVLDALGVPHDTPVGLFDTGQYRNEYRLKTTVGYGAKKTVEGHGEGMKLVTYRGKLPVVRGSRIVRRVPKGSGVPGDG